MSFPTMHPRLHAMIENYPQLEPCCAVIERAHACLVEVFRGGGKVLICGNGGSAADAEHFAGEILKGFGQLRPLPEADRVGLRAEVADKLQGALPVIPLTGFPSLATAFGNDVDPHLVFAQLTFGLGRPGDALIGLSTSGNARNVSTAFEVARARGLHTIAFTGAGGGRLGELAELSIKVPSTVTPRVQEYHLPIYHALALMLEDSFFAAD